MAGLGFKVDLRIAATCELASLTKRRGRFGRSFLDLTSIVRLVATLRSLGEILRLRSMLSDHLMGDAAANGPMDQWKHADSCPSSPATTAVKTLRA